MLSISQFVHMCVCFCVGLFTFEVPFKHLFAPTSWNRLSKIFRDSESLGKSNKKKWSQIWKLLLIKGVKSPRRKKFFGGPNFALLSRIFLVSVFLTPFYGLLPPLFIVQCQDFLYFWNPWGKSNKRSGLRFDTFYS